MKNWKIVQIICIIVAVIYGTWLGCNINATDKEEFTGFVIVLLAGTLALSMLSPEKNNQ